MLITIWRYLDFGKKTIEVSIDLIEQGDTFLSLIPENAVLPKIPRFKASFSLSELHFGGCTPFSHTPVYISVIQ